MRKLISPAGSGDNNFKQYVKDRYGKSFLAGSSKNEDSGYKIKKTLNPVPRKYANIEAELGETLITSIGGSGLPEFFRVGGKPHSKGGTPLNLPEDTFIFSDDAKMKIKDESFLRILGHKKEGTPAALSKKFDLSKHHQTIRDEGSNEIELSTAELMIKNKVNKLGALALAQESLKGFPTGTPMISYGFLESTGIDLAEEVGVASDGEYFFRKGGSVKGRLPKFDPGGSVKDLLNDPDVVIEENSDGSYTVFGKDGKPAYTISPPSEPTTSGKPTKKSNIPSGATIHKVKDESELKANTKSYKNGDYAEFPDGKVYKINLKPKTYSFKDDKLGSNQAAYGHLENVIRNSPVAQQRIYEHYKKHISDSGLSSKEKQELLSASPEEVIDNFLNAQRFNYAIENDKSLYKKDEKGRVLMDDSGNPVLLSEKELKEWETNNSEKFKTTAKKIGFSDADIPDKRKAVMFQAAYRAFIDAKELDTEGELASLQAKPIGLKDSHGRHTYKGLAVSPPDGKWGNTSALQLVIPVESEYDLEYEEVDPYTEEVTTGSTPEYEHFSGAKRDPSAPFWLQDKINTAGAVEDYLGVKKYTPWQADPALFLPDPVFYDPTRELAANAEQANIATQAAQAFSGPQSLASRTSQIQGQAAGNAADVLSRYNDMNVGVANQFEATRASILNQTAINKARSATALFDKNTIANQNFDNEKAHARSNIRGALIQAITNRAQTQQMNSLFNNFWVNPANGGLLEFSGGTPLDGTSSAEGKDVVISLAESYRDTFKDLSSKDALDMAIKRTKESTSGK